MQTMAIEVSEKDIAGPSAFKESTTKNIVSEEKKEVKPIDNKAAKLFGKQ